MSGGEIVGDIAQGALLARAVEPSAGEGAPDDTGHTHERACLNCGTLLAGSHCHGCGQAAHVHKTLAAFFHDLLHGVFHFEGKIWRTLPLLAWRPGRLTREYIDGRRASYVSPIALFLFVVFLTFALFNFAVGPIHLGEIKGPDGIAISTKAETGTLVEIAAVERKLAAARAAGRPTAEFESILDADRKALATIRAAREGKLPDDLALSDNPANRDFVARANAVWRKAKANPDLLIYKIQSSAYKYSWTLIPLSVPFVWLLFPFSRRFGLYDHTVFVTYSLSFMLLLLAAVSLAALGNVPWLVWLLLLYAPLHMYRQIRGTYATSRGGSLVRTAALTVFALVALTLFAAAVITMVVNE